MASGTGTKDDPWVLQTPPGTSEYRMWRDDAGDPPAIICQVGGTQLKYDARAIDDLHAMLKAAGRLGPARRRGRAEGGRRRHRRGVGAVRDQPAGWLVRPEEGPARPLRRLHAAAARGARARRGHPRPQEQPDAGPLTATDRTYWNEPLETIEPDALRILETRGLRRQLAYTERASTFYREKWRAAGADPQAVRGRDDLPGLPFTEKSELQAAQDAAPPFGSNQAAPLDRLVRMQATGGTTSRPMRMALTRHDTTVYDEVGARAAWSAGLRPGDVLFECMNYSLYAGGVNDHMTFETLGACVAPVGIGQSKRLLQVAADLGVDAALYSTPSYAMHLAATARAEGLDPAALRIRKGLFSGDAGLEDPGVRASIEEAFGMVARNIFGTSETAPIGAECDATDGLHFVGQGAYLAELIDVDSGAVIGFGDDVVGELVLTTLDREAHPLIRMRTHDHVRVTTSPMCVRADRVPLPRPGPERRHVHRPWDQRVPTGGRDGHRGLPAAGERRVPGRPARCPTPRATAAGPRGAGRSCR